MELSQKTKLWGSGFNVYSVSISTEIAAAAPRKKVWTQSNSISPQLHLVMDLFQTWNNFGCIYALPKNHAVLPELNVQLILNQAALELCLF